MHESKSGECQLLKSSNCSHHPSDIICEGLHWTSFSPCTLSLKETPRLPPSSPTPWRTRGPDRPAMPTGTNPHHRRALWDLHPHRLAQNVTARSRGQRGQETLSCLCQQVAPALGHQRRCNWWPTSQVQMSHKTTAWCPASGKLCVWAQPPGLGLPRKQAQSCWDDLQRRQKETIKPITRWIVLQNGSGGIQRRLLI